MALSCLNLARSLSIISKLFDYFFLHLKYNYGTATNSLLGEGRLKDL